MAWYKCFSHGGTPTPSEWDIELYDLDFSSSDPDDDIVTGYPLSIIDNWEMVFSIDVDASAYESNNNIGIFTLAHDLTPEQNLTNASIQIAMTNYALHVYIIGRLHFSDDTDTDHQTWGVLTGMTESFEGDYRNKEIRLKLSWSPDWTGFGIIEISVLENGRYNALTYIHLLGYPHWNEDHTIIISELASTNSSLVLGSWYGGVRVHEFDGHLNYFKFKQTEPPVVS